MSHSSSCADKRRPMNRIMDQVCAHCHHLVNGQAKVDLKNQCPPPPHKKKLKVSVIVVIHTGIFARATEFVNCDQIFLL